MARRYDGSTTTFSPEGALGALGSSRGAPDPHTRRSRARSLVSPPRARARACFFLAGRLHQVEYAVEAINNAGTAVGILAADGIVLAGEKQKATKLLAPSKSSEKTYKLDEHVACIVHDGINVAKDVGAKRVITFVGMEDPKIDRDAANANCVKAWKEVIGHAEKNGITLCLEHLNSVDDSHPMKGHPGYQGDKLDFCVEAIKKVGSPNLKLLFDVYHVQIMHGDIIRNIRKLKEYIGHYHTAGNPGRAELDDTQEINYPAVMRAILETGFDGFVAQEFIPTWDDKIAALRHAAEICDV